MNRSQGSKKGQSGRILTSKPFCDCRRCECRNCPDVVQKLALSIKDSKSRCHGKGKGKGKVKGKQKEFKDIKRPSQISEDRPSILDMLNPDRLCDCEIMARAIRSNIHMNIGMTERRGRHSDQRPSNSRDID